MKRSLLADSLLVLFLASVLIWPLFHLEYLDNWRSIESTFISDARMLRNNPPHPGWQPLWYCGTRFDYIYPPALRYGTALISQLGQISTARAYHLYTAILYVFGIVSVYWMVRIGTASRMAALLAATAAALLSPSFLLLPRFRYDSGYWVPQRLHVLMAYGEGPHISAVCVLSAALAATLPALRKWRPAALAAAGVLCAFTVANNFYGATALAIFFPIMVWAVWTGERSWRVWARAGAIAALAFGLSAFWLTPSYFRITLMNLRWVSQPGNTWSMITAAIAVVLFSGISFRLGSRRPDREWPLFVAGLATMLTLHVVGFYYFGFRITGEALRLIPELDLGLILVFVELARAAWKHPRWRIAAMIFILLAFLPARHYLRHAWSPFSKAPSLENQYEYQIAKWVHDHLPGERVLPSGSVRFWFDTWSDNGQPDGGSAQGMLNQNIPYATWPILTGSRADEAILWLRALGTDAVVVPDKKSREPYHDYQYPEKFRGVAPLLYDDLQGTAIYRIPRVHPGIGRMVNREAIGRIRKAAGGVEVNGLSKYVALIEDPAQPAAVVTWRSFDEAAIQARASGGQTVLVQETYDPAWHAYEGNQALPIRAEETMGFMLIDVPAGNHAIRMRFETPLENRVGQVLLVLSLMAVAGLLYLGALKK